MELCERPDGDQDRVREPHMKSSQVRDLNTEVRRPLQLPYAEVETSPQVPREVQFIRGRLVTKVKVKLPVL